MAMLAGPRRKQKVINLRAKNSEWSNDTNKFGQRMLEKMGWSSGKGLGAKENGMVEHVVARYKNDEKGLGFEDKNDQWTKHEDDFNSLLANLSNGDKTEVALHSGVSLEVKSKKSKARVHYHKFTRGKDLTRYSEKDLANIFGKKSLKNEANVQEPINEDIKSTEQVFTEKGSMEDYFKNKLKALKSKSSINYNYVEKEDYEAEYSFQGFTGTSEKVSGVDDYQDSGFQGFSFCNTQIAEKVDNPINSTETDIKKSKKKKKSKKHYNEEVQAETSTEKSDDIASHETEELSLYVKKKKLKKNKQDPPQQIETEIVKTKKNKRPEINSLSNDVTEENNVPKKKKKRKNKE